MIIEIEILKGLLPGAYLLALNSVVELLLWLILKLFSPAILTKNGLVLMSAFSFVGMFVGFLVGFTPTPGTVGIILPAVLTFITGILAFAVVKPSSEAEKSVAALIMIGFTISMTLFLFVGIQLRQLQH